MNPAFTLYSIMKVSMSMSDLGYIRDRGIHEGRMEVWDKLFHCDEINFDFFFSDREKVVAAMSEYLTKEEVIEILQSKS